MESLFDKLGGNKVHQSIRSNRYEQSSTLDAVDIPIIDLIDLGPNSETDVPRPDPPLGVQDIITACCTLKFPEAGLLYGDSLQKCIEEYKRHLLDWPERTPKATKVAVTHVLSTQSTAAELEVFLKHIAQMHKANIFVCATPFYKGLHDTSPNTSCYLISQCSDAKELTLEQAKAYLIENRHFNEDTLDKLFSAAELKQIATNMKLECKKIKRDIIATLMQSKKN